jgi:type IV pilus assembly protein PilW
MKTSFQNKKDIAIIPFAYKSIDKMMKGSIIGDTMNKKYSPPRKKTQRGATLIELMVGITIGLMTIAVATGALMVSRGVSGTITDASQIQQQASYAFRVIGQQLRQAGSMRLDLAANKGPADPIDPADVVVFTPDENIHAATATTPAVSGKDSPSASEYKLSIVYQNYAESSFTSASDVSFFRDCLGNGPALPVFPLEQNIIQSQFVLQSNELRCLGAGVGAQPLIRNIADFQVSYLRQSDGNTGAPKIQTMNATTVGANWNTVYGVEVCIVLFGDEVIDMPVGSTYRGCDGNTINMSSSGTLPTSRKNRLHMAFRTIYQLRSQGLTG